MIPLIILQLKARFTDKEDTEIIPTALATLHYSTSRKEQTRKIMMNLYFLFDFKFFTQRAS